MLAVSYTHLSFGDLVALASSAKPEGALAARFNALLNTPFVHSETVPGDIQPHRPNLTGLGIVVRVGQWNIERGLNFDLIRSALSDPSEFLRMTDTEGRISPGRRKIIESQLTRLQGVDVLVPVSYTHLDVYKRQHHSSHGHYCADRHWKGVACKSTTFRNPDSRRRNQSQVRSSQRPQSVCRWAARGRLGAEKGDEDFCDQSHRSPGHRGCRVGPGNFTPSLPQIRT